MTSSRIAFRDLRGLNVCFGVFFSLLGLLALTSGPAAHDTEFRIAWGLCVFAGGLSLGAGLVRNSHARRQTPSDQPQPLPDARTRAHTRSARTST